MKYNEMILGCAGERLSLGDRAYWTLAEVNVPETIIGIRIEDPDLQPEVLLQESGVWHYAKECAYDYSDRLEELMAKLEGDSFYENERVDISDALTLSKKFGISDVVVPALLDVIDITQRKTLEELRAVCAHATSCESCPYGKRKSRYCVDIPASWDIDDILEVINRRGIYDARI